MSKRRGLNLQVCCCASR